MWVRSLEYRLHWQQRSNLSEACLSNLVAPLTKPTKSDIYKCFRQAALLFGILLTGLKINKKAKQKLRGSVNISNFFPFFFFFLIKESKQPVLNRGPDSSSPFSLCLGNGCNVHLYLGHMGTNCYLLNVVVSYLQSTLVQMSA